MVEKCASFYPNLIIEWEIAPQWIKEAFLNVMRRLKELRLLAKRAKIKAKDLTFKLAMNACSGNFKNSYSPFYSPASSLSMCINGQLMLAMLIENMELAGFECIASNTDGATFKVQNGREDEFNAIAKAWEKLTRMELEETVYEKMVIHAVNDYIAYKEGYSAIKDKLEFHNPEVAIKLNEVAVKLLDDEISQLREKYVKEKGLFITSPRLGKGLDSLITSKALQNHFGRGIPVEETIKSSPYIWDFVKFERVGRQFEVIHAEQSQQRTNRFYVKKGAPYLYKRKTEVKFDKRSGKEYTTHTDQHLLKGWGVELMNHHTPKSIEEYNIDYRYYISQVNTLINELEPKQCELF